MSTTIQVKRHTLRLLERVKRSMNLPSYDEVIRRLLQGELMLKRDMFGVDKGKISRFTEKDRMEDRP